VWKLWWHVCERNGIFVGLPDLILRCVPSDIDPANRSVFDLDESQRVTTGCLVPKETLTATTLEREFLFCTPAFGQPHVNAETLKGIECMLCGRVDVGSLIFFLHGV